VVENSLRDCFVFLEIIPHRAKIFLQVLHHLRGRMERWPIICPAFFSFVI